MTDDALLPQDGRVAADGRPDASPAEAAATSGAGPASALQEERDRYYDLLLRKTAEFDNYRRRTEKERREQADRVTGDLLLEVLPAVDDLERALKAEAASEQAEAYRKGVELIYKQLLDLLKRRGVRAIDAVGVDFDPHLHQAVTTEARDGARDGEILEEFRRGYLIGERLLRPAMVKVARS
jgi:molecular chaperone GrpE